MYFYVFYTLSEEYLGWITSPDYNLLLQLMYPLSIVMVTIIATVISIKYIKRNQK